MNTRRFAVVFASHALVIAPTLALGAASAIALSPSIARADELSDAKSFVAAEHTKLTDLLKTPQSPARETELGKKLDAMVDFDEITRRAFGATCPTGATGCVDHWKDLSDAQKSEVGGLLKRLIQKNYKKNLAKTLDYDVSFTGSRAATGGDIKVRSEAKSKANAREPATQIDYFVKGAAGSLRVVDIVTEGSSLARNYNDQFHRMLTTPDQGYAHIVKKLNEKLNEK